MKIVQCSRSKSHYVKVNFILLVKSLCSFFCTQCLGKTLCRAYAVTSVSIHVGHKCLQSILKQFGKNPEAYNFCIYPGFSINLDQMSTIWKGWVPWKISVLCTISKPTSKSVLCLDTHLKGKCLFNVFLE